MTDDMKILVDNGEDFYVSTEVASFLRELREQDVVEIKEAMEMMKSVKVASKLFKWIMIGIFGAFFTVTTFNTHLIDIGKFLATLFGGAH